MHMASTARRMTTATRWSRSVRMAGLVTLAAGIGATGGCGLRLDILDPAPDGGRGKDAVTDSLPDATPSCAEQVSPSSGRCEITSFTCGIASGCPATWAEAQQPSSCSNGASIVLAGCGGANSWTSYHEFAVLACYYDGTTGTLQGFHEEADHLAFCGNSASSRYVGNVPANCASDGGVYTGGFSCTGPDAGLDQPVPCGGTICAAKQYCRITTSSADGGCGPASGDSSGVCAPIPTGCGGVATCDCLAGLQPGCSCCVPEGGGVFSCGGV